MGQHTKPPRTSSARNKNDISLFSWQVVLHTIARRTRQRIAEEKQDDLNYPTRFSAYSACSAGNVFATTNQQGPLVAASPRGAICVQSRRTTNLRSGDGELLLRIPRCEVFAQRHADQRPWRSETMLLSPGHRRNILIWNIPKNFF